MWLMCCRFVGSVTKSADKLLEHIHTLSQEALDHADLTVLTATIGASALIKNALSVYLQSVTKIICPPKGDESGGSLKVFQFLLLIGMVVWYRETFTTLAQLQAVL